MLPYPALAQFHFRARGIILRDWVNVSSRKLAGGQ